MNEKVDVYIAKHKDFSQILNKLRDIILATGLIETIKWGMPTYTLNNKNIVGMSAFKSHCGIWFFLGALLKDVEGVLINVQEGKTNAMRQWRFAFDSKIDKKLVLKCLAEAIENEKKGLKVKRINKPLVIPPQLDNILKSNKDVENSFKALTLAKKREFADYIMEAKRESTKEKRLEKIFPMIINRIGLNEAYKKA
jgi:uncharacterized protein YdeI (YjbR/CyaY-like superfamily)